MLTMKPSFQASSCRVLFALARATRENAALAAATTAAAAATEAVAAKWMDSERKHHHGLRLIVEHTRLATVNNKTVWIYRYFEIIFTQHHITPSNVPR